VSNESDNAVGMTAVSELHACPACGGLTSIVERGHPDEVRYRRRCTDPWCGRSLPLPESEFREQSWSGPQSPVPVLPPITDGDGSVFRGIRLAGWPRCIFGHAQPRPACRGCGTVV